MNDAHYQKLFLPELNKVVESICELLPLPQNKFHQMFRKPTAAINVSKAKFLGYHGDQAGKN